MNWKRIWIGGFLAAAVLTLFDFCWIAYVIHSAPEGMRVTTYASVFLYMPANIIAGVMMSGLYALVRPRLGPGPRTALVVGSFSFALVHLYTVFHVQAWMAAPLYVLGQSVALWFKFTAATYLAGWQYIEKSPE